METPTSVYQTRIQRSLKLNQDFGMVRFLVLNHQMHLLQELSVTSMLQTNFLMVNSETKSGPSSHGTKLDTQRLISDSSTLKPEVMTLIGQNADGTQLSLTIQDSSSSHMSLNTSQFATLPKPSSMLNQDISYLSFASNGLIL